MATAKIVLAEIVESAREDNGGSRPALVTELKTAHGVQIVTRRFVGHEKLFAYRELGRRAIVALSGIQAPKRAYKTNGEGTRVEVEDRRLNGWKEIEKYVGLHKETIVRHGYPVHKAPGGKSSTVFAFTKELLEHGLNLDTLKT